MRKALGLTLSNTAWVCQFETNVSSTGTHSTLIGLVDSGGNMNNTSILCDYNGSNKIIMREYNSGLTVMGSGISISTGTQYYVTVIRTSLTGLTLEVRTGSHSGTLVGSESGTITGATDLDHVQSGAYGRGTGSATFVIDNVKIYNGVTTATGTPVYETIFSASSDLPENTLFEETDTYKTYWLQSSAWTINPPVLWNSEVRGVCGGGNSGSVSNVIDKFTIQTTGNATDFGDLVTASVMPCSFDNSVRGCFANAGDNAAQTAKKIEYITILTDGNATTFGDMVQGTADHVSGNRNGTRGTYGNTYTGSLYQDIEYVTIDTTGNATNFGNTSYDRSSLGSCADETRAVWFGGQRSGLLNVIDYVTVATLGNATDFGNLTLNLYYTSGCSDNSRGCIMGGEDGNATATSNFITIQTTGNAATYGSLATARYRTISIADKTRGVTCGGAEPSKSNIMEYFTIQNSATAVDFGNLTVARDFIGGVAG